MASRALPTLTCDQVASDDRAMSIMAEKSALLPPSIDEKRSYDIDETVSAPHRPSTRFITLVLFLAIWTICSDITARHAPLNVWKPCGWSKTIVLPSLEEQKATEKAFLRVPTPESILEVSRKCVLTYI